MTNPALSTAIDFEDQKADAFEASAKAAQFRRFCADRNPATDTLDTLDTLDGGKACASGLRQLLALPCPAHMSPPEWDTFSWRVLNFALEWAAPGRRYGWSILEMFGCNPEPSARRVDRNGVAMTLGRMLSPLTVAAVDADAWHFTDQRGSLLRFTRMDRDGQIPMWIAFSSCSGP